jgi:hypothetical protein
MSAPEKKCKKKRRSMLTLTVLGIEPNAGVEPAAFRFALS